MNEIDYFFANDDDAERVIIPNGYLQSDAPPRQIEDVFPHFEQDGEADDLSWIASDRSANINASSGTGSPTDGADISAASGSQATNASGSPTESADVSSGSGSAAAPTQFFGNEAELLDENLDVVIVPGRYQQADPAGAAGTGSPTEGADSSSGSGSQATSGSGAPVETSDASSGSGSGAAASNQYFGSEAEMLDDGVELLVIPSGFQQSSVTAASGSGSPTEGADTSAGSGSTPFQPMFDDTIDWDDTTNDWMINDFGNDDAVIGSGSPTEGADTSSGSGGSGASGSGAPTDSPDTSSGVGAASTSGSGSPTESPDASSGIGQASAAGSGSPTEGADTSSGTGATLGSGSGAPTESPDTSSGAGTQTDVGSGSPTDSPDTGAGSGAASGTGSGSPTEQPDTSTGSGTTTQIGAGAPTESPDISSGSGAAIGGGTGSPTDSPDTSSGSGSQKTAGSGTASEAGDVAAGAGTGSTSGSGSPGDSADTSAGIGFSTPAGGTSVAGPRYIICHRYARNFTVKPLSKIRFDEFEPAEADVLIFDFTIDLLASELLSGTPTVAFSLAQGADPSPGAIANGTPSIDPTGKKVYVPVKSGILNNDYQVQVSIGTTNPFKTKTLIGILPIRA